MRFFIFIFIPYLLFALSLDESRHLMGRTSFAPTKNIVEILSSKNRQDSIDFLLKLNENSDFNSPPSWVETPLVKNKPFKKMSAQKRQMYRKEFRKRVIELKSWWLKNMIETSTPLREKMTLFWHNHFTSSIKKVRSPYLMYKQNQLLRRNALGNFKTLLHKISKDPAMVIYLDNQSNKKQNPNENYAREVMELFTLGEGHYSEKDVRAAAKAFTGWRVNRKKGKFVFVKKFHDFSKKEFLGKTGNFDGDDILNIILEKKRTAEFITQKFYKEFINEKLNEKEVQRIAKIFYDSGYDIKVLLKEILMSDDFWDVKHRGVLVKSPVELIVGTLRSFDIQPKKVRGLVFASRNLKQDIFNPPNVKGWDGGISWLDANSILLRNQIISRFVRGKEKAKGMSMRMAKKSNSLFKNKNLTHKQKVKYLKSYLLALKPIDSFDESKEIQEIVGSLVLDPVYQLK